MKIKNENENIEMNSEHKFIRVNQDKNNKNKKENSQKIKTEKKIKKIERIPEEEKTIKIEKKNLEIKNINLNEIPPNSKHTPRKEKNMGNIL